MLFTSFDFLLFLPIVFVLYWFVFYKSLNHQNLLLLVASYVFYGWWNWRFLGLLILSTLIDYSFGFWVERGKKRKLFLWLSMLNNLLVLGIFKYYNFFALETQRLLDQIGFHTSPVLIKIALPVGISFYTFHGMSYVIDIYRGKQKPVRSFVDYSVFVSFFPLLVAGPIERATHLLPQVRKPRTFNYTQGVQGLRLILWGLFKKMVIANTLSPIVDDIFSHYTVYPGSTLVLGAIYFSFQIYCDFSGYSDIAIGVAKLFGFELLSNFRFPYFSRDLAEFWRRWHISLSSWFRDYLYIPLGGSREGKFKAVRNTFVIFLISGFWHGANWTFIAWGGIHALGFLPLLLLGQNRKNTGQIVAQNSRIPGLKDTILMLLTFSFVTLAWIFFRSDTIGHAVSYILNMRRGLFTAPALKSFLFIYVLPLILIDWCFRRQERELVFTRFRPLRYAIYIVAVYTIIYHSGNNSNFIYFQF